MLWLSATGISQLQSWRVSDRIKAGFGFVSSVKEPPKGCCGHFASLHALGQQTRSVGCAYAVGKWCGELRSVTGSVVS